MNAESTGATNRRFTSYDRSTATGLDYAINRHYDSQQGRFTQVDPIGMGDASAENPQSFNLYAYCGNDPINHTDPSGLGFFSFLKRLFGKIVHAFKAAAVAFVTAFITGGNFRTARRDAIRAFVSDLGFRTRTWNTPQWNPNAIPILSGGPSALSRYIINNFTNQGRGIFVNLTTLRRCVKELFKVDLVSFKLARPGADGSFKGTGKDIIMAGGSRTTIQVTNDVNRFSTATMPGGATPGQTVVGFTPKPTAANAALGFNPYRNYGANNIVQSGYDLGLLYGNQIHELGNSLHYITGESPTAKKASKLGDTDWGIALEECVFGGHVNGDGKIER